MELEMRDGYPMDLHHARLIIFRWGRRVYIDINNSRSECFPRFTDDDNHSVLVEMNNYIAFRMEADISQD